MVDVDAAKTKGKWDNASGLALHREGRVHLKGRRRRVRRIRRLLCGGTGIGLFLGVGTGPSGVVRAKVGIGDLDIELRKSAD